MVALNLVADKVQILLTFLLCLNQRDITLRLLGGVAVQNLAGFIVPESISPAGTYD